MLAAGTRRAVVALVVLSVAGAAAAAASTEPHPAAGGATSSVNLLELSVGGHHVVVAKLALASGAASGRSIAIPIQVDGTAYGQRTANGTTAQVPSLSSDTVIPASLARLVSASSPRISMGSGPGSARAATDSLGTVDLLGLSMTLNGTARAAVSVDGVHAGAVKTLTVRNLALPSIAGLLGTLGLDLTKLPTSTLQSLVEQLGLVTPAVQAASAALAAALAPLQPALTAARQQATVAQAAVTSATAQVATATGALGTATTTLNDATQALQAALGTVPHLRRAGLALALPSTPPAVPAPTVLPAATVSSPTAVPPLAPATVPTTLPAPAVVLPTVPTVLPTSLPTALPTALPTTLPPTLPVPSLPVTVPTAAQPLVDAYNAAAAAYSTAVAQLNVATTALNAANGVLNSANGVLDSLLATVSTQVGQLTHVLVDVLGATPLVSIDSFSMRTEASATSASAGGQTARVVGGQLQGVHVLGTDVLPAELQTPTGTLSQDAAGPLARLQGKINAATSALSTVLSSVPSLPGLVVPAPQVQLLSSSTATRVSNGFGIASDTASALRITVPALTIPAAVALPGAAGLAVPAGPAVPALHRALRASAVGSLVSTPLTLALGVFQETVRFRPAVGNPGRAGAPGAPTGPLGASPHRAPNATGPTGAAPLGTDPQASPRLGTPTSFGPTQLPRTGLPTGVAVLALALSGGGLLLRRQVLR